MSKCDTSKRNSKIKVCVMGSGNWGTAIAKIVGENCAKLPEYNDLVPMYVHEEKIGGKKLTDIINQTRENVKYLPGHVLPQNVVAVPNNVTVAKNADIIIFVLPHEFVPMLCNSLLGKIKPNCIGISLVKGFIIADGGGIDLISHVIQRTLRIKCSVLMGANLATEIAESKFAEATIGCRDYNDAKTLRDLFQTDNFRISVVPDADTVEACGALKNIVACGVGFTDGLELGFNTKAAVIRLGLMEMMQFVTDFYPGGKQSTFFESCGVADLIATCFGGRNRRVAEAMVTTGKSLEALEKELLNGQKLQGPATAHEVNHMLEREDMIDKYPLFTAVHQICKGEAQPSEFIEKIRNHPINELNSSN